MMVILDHLVRILCLRLTHLLSPQWHVGAIVIKQDSTVLSIIQTESKKMDPSA